MTLSIPLSSEVFVATDAEGRDIFTAEITVKSLSLNYVNGTITADCTVPARSDVVFLREISEDGILDDTSEATLVAALALDIEANFPAEKPPEAAPEAEAPPEDAPEEEPAE